MDNSYAKHLLWKNSDETVLTKCIADRDPH